MILQVVTLLWQSPDTSSKVVYPTCHLLEGSLLHHRRRGGHVVLSRGNRFLNTGSDIFDFPPNTHPRKAPIGAYTGKMDPEETKCNRYLSLASKFVIPPHDTTLFSRFPRSYIMGGRTEHLFDDIVALAKKTRDDGVDIATGFPLDAVHAYPIFGWYEPERTDSFVGCAGWLDKRRTPTVVIERPYEPEDTYV